MKKDVLIRLSMVAVLLAFSFSLFAIAPSANPKDLRQLNISKSHPNLHPKHAHVSARVFRGDVNEARARRERWQREQRHSAQQYKLIQHLAAKQPPTPTPQRMGAHSGALTENAEHINIVADADGYFVYLGTCTNTSNHTVITPRAQVIFTDEQLNVTATYENHIKGGTRVRLLAGPFADALAPGETGFFKIYTTEPYDQWTHFVTNFEYDTLPYSPTVAGLQLQGEMKFLSVNSFTEVSGIVTNPHSDWVAYNTVVYVCLLKQGGAVYDIDYMPVYGTNYGAYIGALYPGKSGSFNKTFESVGFSLFSGDYYYGIQWREDDLTPLTETAPPFGDFDSPREGAVVRSSIPVTGWAIDDAGLEYVKIYCHYQGNTIFIGNAVQVDGARPDVAAAFPEYFPHNISAGWGYMLLTNFLPDGGNGTYQLEAVAYDKAGKSASLGTRTIICDNDNAVKPFGAIDTPDQGGTAYGTIYNWGWVLTPQPNTMPTDGSTIGVYVDGILLGRPVYNLYRQDIYFLFPDYNNSSGAVGRFELDTTAFTDGVHSIHWIATDDAGNTDGIGSRYFTIANSSSRATAADSDPSAVPNPWPLPLRADPTPLETIDALPHPNAHTMTYKIGYNDAQPMRPLHPYGPEDTVSLAPLDRIVIRLSETPAQLPGHHHYSGYLETAAGLRPLPAGSHLDPVSGLFHWIPGPGFNGQYRLIFLDKGENGKTKQAITLTVAPRY